MTVEQTLSLDDCIRLLAEMAEEVEGKRDAADNRASATTGTLKVMEENERDRYAQEHEALTRALAVIKAAQAVAEDASVEMRKEGGTPQFYGVGRVAMERLLSLLSPEQKKEAK